MPCGGEDVVDNDIETDNLLSAKTRQQTSRTICKDSSEPSDTDCASVFNEKNCKFNQRCSNRLNKRLKKEPCPVDFTSKKPVIAKPAAPATSSKTRRPWELWSVDDKNSFFEALCEYGKDFENIQSYIAQRSKKKGIATNMIKNKDQVRHFYYRTWHKISKFLDINESVRKQTQELYGLINYAELRKKIGGCLNEKNRQKLNELVFSGVTVVKYKGKKLRIKTPVCRALKKLNHIDDTNEPDTDKLPKEIIVEFRPHTNLAWLHVQNLAQNPRVRTKVCLQKRLKSVIDYLQKRWKPYRLKRKEHILSSLQNSYFEDMPCDIQPLLRVKPSKDAKIYPLLLSSIDVASNFDVCLEKHIKLSHKSLCKDMKTKKTLCLNQKIHDDKLNENSEIAGENFILSSDNAVEGSDNFIQSDMQDLCLKSNKNNVDYSYPNVLTPPKSVPEMTDNNLDGQRPHLFSSSVDSTYVKGSVDCVDKTMEVCQVELNFRTFETNKLKEESKRESCVSQVELQQSINGSDSLSDLVYTNVVKKNTSTVSRKVLNEKLNDVMKEDESTCIGESLYNKTIRCGWTSNEAGYLTVGELYLLLGKPSSILLEYEFEPPDKEEFFGASERENKKRVLDKVLEVAQTLFTDKNKQMLGKRGSSKSSKVKGGSMSEKALKDCSTLQVSNKDPVTGKEELVVNKESFVIKNVSKSTSVISSDNLLDKHIFAKPIGIAPRSTKTQNLKNQPPTQSSLKEELGKLLPHTRRGCRVRRKPLVVQRPLLPREGMPRPMTLLHIVPSISPITTILPSNCAAPETKMSIPPPKKVVQILPSGPMQVPIVKPVRSDPGPKLIFPQKSVPVSHVLVNASSKSTIQIINGQNMPCISPINSTITSNSTADSTSVQNASVEEQTSLLTEMRLPSPPNLDGICLDILSESQKEIMHSEDEFDAINHMSMLSDSDISLSTVSSNVESSFLEELELGTKSKGFAEPPSSNYIGESLPSMKTQISPGSPVHQNFRVNSPEMQWLNGEVDSQVRCLLDECSIDFITKFEDLADVINN